MPTDPDEPEASSLIERRISEAMERGEFDDLPGAGRPISDLDAGYDPAWWAKRYVERARLIERQTELVRLIERDTPRLSVPSLAEGARERIAGWEAELSAIDDRLPPGERSGHPTGGGGRRRRPPPRGE